MGQKYTALLGGLDNIQLPLEKTMYAENIYWVFGIVLNDGVQLGEEGDQLGALDLEGNVRGVAIQLTSPFGPMRERLFTKYNFVVMLQAIFFHFNIMMHQ